MKRYLLFTALATVACAVILTGCKKNTTEPEPTYTYSVEAEGETTLDFGTVPEGYDPQDLWQSVSVRNTGAGTVTISATVPEEYENITGNLSDGTEIKAPEGVSVDFRPKAGLAPGNYDRTFSIVAKNGETTVGEIPVTLKFTVVAVGDMSYALGDYWPDDADPEGVVFWVKPGSEGKQGKVVGLDEAYVAQWGPENDEQAVGVEGIRNLTDGATATKNMIAKYNGSPSFREDYPAFFHIYSEVNGGDKNGPWYLPARDELRMLFAGASGKVYEDITDWTSSNMPGYDSAECTTSREAFNEKLDAKGGAAFGSGDNGVNWWYISSTEIAEPTYYSFTFEEGLYSADNKNLDGNIRWIREF